MQRRLLGVIGALAITAAACTPGQYLRYVDAVMSGHEAEAKVAVAEYEATRALYADGRPCFEWYDNAIDAGWLPEQWPQLSHIMWRESRCNPSARNPSSSATGLLQELKGHAPSCGGVWADLYDPDFNLRCGVWLFQHGGWDHWALTRG